MFQPNAFQLKKWVLGFRRTYGKEAVLDPELRKLLKLPVLTSVTSLEAALDVEDTVLDVSVDSPLTVCDLSDVIPVTVTHTGSEDMAFDVSLSLDIPANVDSAIDVPESSAPPVLADTLATHSDVTVGMTYDDMSEEDAVDSG